MKRTKKQLGEALIGSVLLCVIGLLFIDLGLSLLPIIGIFMGAGFLWFGLYPWMNFLHRRNVKVLVGSVGGNYPEGKRIAVAILSAARGRDGFDFDPALVDPRSVRVGAGDLGPIDDMADPQTHARSLKDINDDGVPDLILYFSADSAGIGEKFEEVCVRAKMRSGERVVGCNEIDPWHESVLVKKLEYMQAG